MDPKIARALDALNGIDPQRPEGKVVGLVGLSLRATLPGARVGDLVHVRRHGSPLPAEVLGFDDGHALLLPLGTGEGIAIGDPVRSTGKPLSFPCGETLLGRVVDALGHPLDGGPPIDAPRSPSSAQPPTP